MAEALVIERVFDATLEKVWAAWTDPEQVKKWWGPKDFTAPSITSDFRVGGKYLYAMHGPAGTEFDKDMWSTGTYKEIVPPDPSNPSGQAKIVATDSFADEQGNVVSSSHYGMEGMPMELTLTVTFEDLGDGRTKLIIHHEGFPAGPHFEGANEGWNQSLDKLAEALK